MGLPDLALLVAFAVVAPVNWWSRWVSHVPTERWSKPLATALLLALATIADAPGDVRGWTIAAVALSLGGDVALMWAGGFLAGLVLFLLAHLAYLSAVLADPSTRWVGVVLAVILVVGMVPTTARRIVAAASDQPATVAGGVVIYIAVILLMASVALIAGPWLTAAGALVFVASDSCLGWNRFVRRARALETATMVTYHLGQLAMVAGLVVIRG
jgi:uncharacterized membrane protein YhhN